MMRLTDIRVLVYFPAKMRSIEPDASTAQALDRHKIVILGGNQLQVI
jgi:hypothetical protein